MKILCLYVLSGNGHLVPARTMKIELEKLGHEVRLEQVFDVLKMQLVGKLNRIIWREMLRHSKTEEMIVGGADHSNAISFLTNFCLRHRMKTLKAYLDDFPCDAIFATHPYGSTILSEMIKAMGLSIPVYYYATDVFFSPSSAISNNLRKLYIPTEEGKEWVISIGQDRDKSEICPFPLQQNVKESPRMSKNEARAKLGLDDVFTLQLNMGGEGLGSLALLDALAKKDYEIQILVLGSIDKKMQKKVESIKRTAGKNVRIIPTGFVKNVNEYLFASDIVAGRLGINTILEAFYLKRPFLVTELVYSVKPAAQYIEKYGVGWNCNQDVPSQVKVIDTYAKDAEKLAKMDDNFGKIPITYDAGLFAKQLVKDIEEYKKNT